MKKNNFWKDGLSISETKTSVLVILTLIGVMTAIVLVIIRQTDITPEFAGLLKSLIYSIAGVNGVKAISDSINRSNSYNDSEIDELMHTYDRGDEYNGDY